MQNINKDAGKNPVWSDTIIFWIKDQTTIKVTSIDEGISDSEIGNG